MDKWIKSTAFDFKKYITESIKSYNLFILLKLAKKLGDDFSTILVSELADSWVQFNYSQLGACFYFFFLHFLPFLIFNKTKLNLTRKQQM